MGGVCRRDGRTTPTRIGTPLTARQVGRANLSFSETAREIERAAGRNEVAVAVSLGSIVERVVERYREEYPIARIDVHDVHDVGDVEDDCPHPLEGLRSSLVPSESSGDIHLLRRRVFANVLQYLSPTVDSRQLVISVHRHQQINRVDGIIFDQDTDISDTGTDSGSSGGEPGDPVTRLLRWVLLYGDRRVLTLVTTIVILLALLILGTVWEFEMERLVTETRAVQTLFNTLLGGIILFVSVVLSINTAALAQEFAPLQVKLARIEESIEFQIELEELVDEGASPAGLRPFLEHVIGAIQAETESLRASEDATDDERARADLLTFVDEIDTQLSLIENHIARPNPKVFIVLFTALEYPYARHINLTRRLKSIHGDALTESEHTSLSTLLQGLTILASGREYFTTLYFKRELRNLSSSLLLLSLPVIVFTAYVLLAIDAGLFPQTTVLGLDSRHLYVNLAFVVALSPYVLLSSYMLRILTVSKQSLESTMFTLDSDFGLEFDR